MTGRLSYDAVGATRPGEAHWSATSRRFRRHEETVLLGRGDRLWSDAARLLMAWGVKTGSGFTVSATTVTVGDVVLVARVGPLRIREPARVVAVVEEVDRVGYAYGTRPGHPVRGEEAFVLHRDGSGVHLTLRSLTAPPRGPWLLAYPVTLLAQQWYRRRYRRALLLTRGGP